MTHTPKAVALRMPEMIHMHRVSHRILTLVQGKEGEGILSTVYKMRKGQRLRKVASPKITQELLDHGFEPRTFKYLIVYHIYSLRFSVMAAYFLYEIERHRLI